MTAELNDVDQLVLGLDEFEIPLIDTGPVDIGDRFCFAGNAVSATYEVMAFREDGEVVVMRRVPDSIKLDILT